MRKHEFKSSSSDKIHTVTEYDDGRIVCTCRGYRTPNKCWHVREVVEKSTPTPDPFPGGIFTPTKFIKPMLASALKEGQAIDKFTDDFVLEEKYDGHRIILHVDSNITAWSRNEKTRDLPEHIMEACRNLPCGTYDGELFIPGATSTDVVRVDRQHELKLVLFDMLRVGDDGALMHETGGGRRRFLEQACSLLETDDIFIAPQFPVSEFGLQKIWTRGGEGAIVKDTRTCYAPGKRSTGWVKFKKKGAAEVTITGFIAGKLGPQSIIVGIDAHGVEVQVKARNDKWREDLGRDPEMFVGRKLTISYQQKTRDGRYRHPMADHLL